MIANKIYLGDALSVLQTFNDKCVDCCITSPPYYGLRDYGVDGQIGLESIPEEYIARLVEIFAEVKRVLKDNGTLWVNIGDSYAGSGKGAANYPDNTKKYKQGTNRGMLGKTACNIKVNLKAKNLIGIPWMLAFALRDKGWYLRQDIIWVKPNPMPESVLDRCTKSHEYIFLFSKSPVYYFDNNAIKEPCVQGDNIIRDRDTTKLNNTPSRTRMNGLTRNNYEYRNKRDVWVVSNKPNHSEHYAAYPLELIEPCVLAGCPVNGMILDPFCGTGTTGVAALKHGRNFVGIDINEEYTGIANKRIADTRNKIFVIPLPSC